MIYRITVSGVMITRLFCDGEDIPRTTIAKGLPRGAALVYVHPGRDGEWCLLFEGKPASGPDVEGAIKDICPEYTSHYPEREKG